MILAIVLTYSSHHSIKAMPVMNFGNTNEMESLSPSPLQIERGLMQGDAIEVDTIADADGALAKDTFSIRKSY